MPTHKVHFQPVDIDIDVNEDETVLNAAFRQGVSLTHGCREGQCSACKSFLLDGDIEMEKYSTFALPEYESEEGYVLLCRCHAYSDLEVELINYDEDIIRLGIPIESFRTIVEAIEPLTHDIKRLVLNDMAERGIKRKATYFYGARTRKDLFYLDRLQELEKRLPGFRFVPALSMASAEDEWDGETGLITEVLDRNLEPGQTETQAYLCGPPPMIDAAIPVLIRKGISEDRIFFDKFTSTGKVE